MKQKDIQVLIVEPMKLPRLETIKNTLAELQQIVGGFIEVIAPFNDSTLLSRYTHVDEEQRMEAVRAVDPIGCNRVAIIEQNKAISGNKEIPKTLQPQGS